MANASTLLRKENRFRRGKDTLARIGVTAGGIFVLITLMLIFFYLLYVIVPIFSSVSVTPKQHFSLPVASKTALLGVDDSNTIAYRFSHDGKVTFINLPSQSQSADVVKQQIIIANPTAYGVSLPRDGMIAYGTTQGQVTIVKPEFALTFADAHKQLQPSIEYPFGKTPLALAPTGEAITQLAISGRDDRTVVVGKTATNHLYGLSLLLPENVIQRAQGWQQHQFAINNTPVKIDDFQLTPDGKTLYVLSGSNLYLYKLTPQSAFLRKIENVATGSSKPVSITLLSGANSLLITNSNNTISQWFEAVKEGQRQLIKVRTFQFSASPLVKIVPEYYRKGFFAIQKDGTTSAYYTAERKVIYKEKVFSKVPTDIAISPKANLLVTFDDGRWQSYQVKNAHPDIGLSSLLQKVWYEGYAEPDYVWQSTSASDEFEPKLSLVPIVFGTLKAAIYSMFFAIPLALAGAIYTAYFMSNKVRKVIKPTVELMEALPTVILGFLAGVWLAPIVEQYLAGIALGIFFLPLSIIVVGWSWSMLPGQWRSRVPNGFHIALLIPVIIAVTYGCFGLSPWIETQFFHGDLQGYLNNHLGIGYDQRNALIVGIAMGFAVIPTIFTIAEDAIFSVPAHLTKGSLALGATQWQTLTKVVLLTASPGIFSAIMMGLGRAVGETMIVLMATGNTPVMDWNLLQGLRTLAATIAIEMPESEVGSSHYRVLFLAAFVLFVFTFVFNTIAEVVRQRLREKYSSL
ncbi:ABC transporter permease subunit [Photobacterium kishitanii]|uniref:ABC transporter permease subunit n=1 Tax=Photobacterium kishitanii TaxID=318456 RepID=UPI0007F900F6|nr:ABC transporter permease subunit [Photobacterium kishitanii]OBU31818.1 phosphate ABC transporter permease [Photobacterium kishitanii]PSU22085.1 phosphate ABC transporter permease [Photobacterium kishitanii]PSW50720.1 phosphate ABC transporter permease [Photobacterium kishitanii]PSW63045.1 phosphate ABC transporter permease [Photobacterium kishitanii]